MCSLVPSLNRTTGIPIQARSTPVFLGMLLIRNVLSEAKSA